MREDPIPTNPEAEQAALGSLILDPDAIHSVIGFLKPEHFHGSVHRSIYEGICALYEQRVPADVVTLGSYLSQHEVDVICGEVTLNGLVNVTPSSANILDYARSVVDTAVYRRVIFGMAQIPAIVKTAKSGEEAVRKAVAVISQAGSQQITEHTAALADIGPRYMARLDQTAQDAQTGKRRGVTTGLFSVDEQIGFLQNGTLSLLAARPGVGKTSMAIGIGRHAAQMGKRVLFFSLEMAQEELYERLLADAALVDSQRLRLGKLTEAEWDRVVAAEPDLASLPFFIDDTPELTPFKIQASCHAQKPIGLVIVDYVQLMQTDTKCDSREQEVNEIARKLKLLARELDVPILALAQLNRAVESRAVKIPQMSDLRESGGLENHCDNGFFIYRDPHETPEQILEQKKTSEPYLVYWDTFKARMGPMGAIPLRFIPRITRFRDPAEPQP